MGIGDRGPSGSGLVPSLKKQTKTKSSWIRPSAKSRREWELFGVRFLAGNLQHCYWPLCSTGWAEARAFYQTLYRNAVRVSCLEVLIMTKTWWAHPVLLLHLLSGKGHTVHLKSLKGSRCLHGSDPIKVVRDDKDGISAGKLLTPKVVAVLSHTAGQWCLVCATISDTFPCSESQGLAYWGEVLHITEQLSLLREKASSFKPDFSLGKVIKANCDMSYPFEFTGGSTLHEGP